MYLSTLLILSICHFINNVISRKSKLHTIVKKALLGIRNQRIKSNPSYPTFYPNGWTFIFTSNEVSINKVKSIIVFGKVLYAFRSTTGQVYVIELLCSHLSEFDVKAVSICEECKKGKKESSIKFWQVLERNNVIYIWYHSNNQNPSWLPVEYKDSFVIHKNVPHSEYLTAIFQDNIENGVDLSHLSPTHKLLIPPTSLFGKIISKIFHTTFKAEGHLSNDGSRYIVNIAGKPTLFGKKILDIFMKAEMQSRAIMTLELTAFGFKSRHLYLLNAIHNNRFRTTLVTYGNADFLSRIHAHLMRATIIFTASQDTLTFENKIYIKEPLFTKLDTNIIQYRKFCRKLDN